MLVKIHLKLSLSAFSNSTIYYSYTNYCIDKLCLLTPHYHGIAMTSSHVNRVIWTSRIDNGLGVKTVNAEVNSLS